jgi:hypothetical protein
MITSANGFADAILKMRETPMIFDPARLFWNVGHERIV